MAQEEKWSEEELRSSVKAYIDIRRLQMLGEAVKKAAVYRLLAEQYARTAKSFEYRMQNISHVFALMGRPWASGSKPARNVGAITAAKLEELIHLEQGTTAVPVAAFEQEVAEAGKHNINAPPTGQRKPATQKVVSTHYVRDAKVVAWVLQEAKGHCERCDRPAPFTRTDGKPYLEVHHIRALAYGGSDTVSNAAALCPNCHRE